MSARAITALRFSRQEKAWFTEAAKREGLTLSAWIRKIATRAAFDVAPEPPPYFAPRKRRGSNPALDSKAHERIRRAESKETRAMTMEEKFELVSELSS